MMTWIHSIAEASGYPTGGPIVQCIEDFQNLGESVSKRMPVFGKGMRLIKEKKLGYCLAVGLLQHRFGPQAIEQFRAISGDTQLGFDIGASIHTGHLIADAPSNMTDACALAGFYLAHGIVGSPHQLDALKIAVRQPEYRIGVAVAVRSIRESRKSGVQRAIETALGI